MITSPRAAAGAYAGMGRIAELGRAVAPDAAAAGGQGGDFAGMVRTTLGAVTDSARTAETRMQGYAAGRVDLVDVVTAVAETEVALETMVSIRDRVIQSYEEIMRMPI